MGATSLAIDRSGDPTTYDPLGFQFIDPETVWCCGETIRATHAWRVPGRIVRYPWYFTLEIPGNIAYKVIWFRDKAVVRIRLPNGEKDDLLLENSIVVEDFFFERLLPTYRDHLHLLVP